MSKEASGDIETVYFGWTSCGNCEQLFEGALDLEMARRFWRRHRSDQDLNRRYNSLRSLADCLCFGDRGELDAAYQLYDEASNCVGDGLPSMDVRIQKATVLWKRDQNLEALELLQGILPEAMELRSEFPDFYQQTMDNVARVYGDLGRHQDCLNTADELIEFTKERFGSEHRFTLSAKEVYAEACVHLDRVEEAKAIFDDVLMIKTRILGRDHSTTQNLRERLGVLVIPL